MASEATMEPRTLSRGTAAAQAEAFISEIPPFPGDCAGRGVVICAGGEKYFTEAWIAINALRNTGCTLPIELWYLGPSEMSQAMVQMMEPLDVTCVDAYAMRDVHPARILNGRELKPYAILHSRFADILLIDSDCLTVRNPEYLFDQPEYREFGALFWSRRSTVDRIDPRWRIFDLSPRAEPELDVGFMVIDKAKCWRALCLCKWYNDYSDFYYQYVYGGRETFRLAFLKTETEYRTSPIRPDDNNGVLIHRDFNGEEICRHGVRWEYFRRRSTDRASGLETCFELLDDLRTRWDGEVNPAARYQSHLKPEALRFAASELLDTVFMYERVGYDARQIVFISDGTIGLGAGGRELFWDINRDEHGLMLDISGEDGRTCRLFREAGNRWVGAWEVAERMPIEVYPSLDFVPEDSTEYLTFYCPASRRRAALLDLLKAVIKITPTSPTLVEVGTVRGSRISDRDSDGWSTVVFGWFAGVTSGRLHSVDRSLFAIDVSRRVTKSYSQWIDYHVSTDPTWSVKLPEDIDLLYLDLADDDDATSVAGYVDIYDQLQRRPKLVAIPRAATVLHHGDYDLVRRLHDDGYVLISTAHGQMCFAGAESGLQPAPELTKRGVGDIIARPSPDHLYSREYIARVYTHDRGDFKSLRNSNVLIYWPHGFGDWVFLSQLLPFLDDSNLYWVTRFGDDTVSLLDGCPLAEPIYLGMNSVQCDHGAAVYNKHFGLDYETLIGGDPVRLRLPLSLYETCVANDIDAVFWSFFPEVYGSGHYPYHTKARHLLPWISSHGSDAVAKPLPSAIRFESDSVKRWVEAKLKNYTGFGQRKLCIIARNGYSSIQKNWGHLWREELPTHKQQEGEECRDFMRLMLRKNDRWCFLLMEDSVFDEDSDARENLHAFSYGKLFLAPVGGAPPFGQIMKALISLADLVVGVPTGPYHLAMVNPEVPTVGLWIDHLPEWYDDPKSNAIHLISRNVIEKGLDKRPGTQSVPQSMQHDKRMLDTFIIPANAVLSAVEELIG